MTQEIAAAGLPLPRRMWWPWNERAGRVAFERSFTANTQAQATLYVSASGPYQAWLDGNPLPAPPAAAASPLPSWRDIHRISLDVAPGEHRLSLEAGPGQQGPLPACPFLLACLDWQEGSYPVRVASDGEWRMAANPPAGWATGSGTPEPAWRLAWAFDGVWAEPWGMPCNAPDDFCRLSHGWQVLTAERLFQVAGLFQGLTSAGALARIGEDGVEMRPPQPYPPGCPRLGNARPRLEWYRTRETHSQLLNNWLDLYEARAPHVIYDAGAETFARIRVCVRGGGPAIVAVTTGESLAEVSRYTRRVTDLYTLEDGETFTTAPTGFRYVKITVLSAGGGDVVSLEPPEIQHIRHDVAQAGRFTCSDPRLDAIWQLSARTVHLCMQNEIWDGIKRDQLPWMGDLYTEALAAYHVFGDARLVRRTLEILGELGPAPARPLERQPYPGLHAIWRKDGSDINGIPSYTLWWLAGMADYLLYTGDRSLVQELAGEIQATIQHITEWVDAGGLWQFQDGWDYVDWAPIPAPERQVFCHLLACQALRQGADLLAAISQPTGAQRALYDRMVEAARRTWWRDGQGEFGASHHVNAMAIRSGILSRREGSALFARTLEDDPAYPMTYWHRYADLDAAQQVAQVGWGLAYLRRHWGHALQLGMTSLWEAFDPAWIGPDPHAVSMIGGENARYGGYETSLCHGWSAGPAVWLHTAVLGMRPVASGFMAVVLNPALGDLAWAEGTIPTPEGPIEVRLRREGAHNIADVSVPDGVAVGTAEHPHESWEVHVTAVKP